MPLSHRSRMPDSIPHSSFSSRPMMESIVIVNAPSTRPVSHGVLQAGAMCLMELSGVVRMMRSSEMDAMRESN